MLFGIIMFCAFFSTCLDLGGEIAGNAIYLRLGVALVPIRAVYLFLLMVGFGVMDVVGRGVMSPGSGDYYRSPL